jgi:F-type H+-transporting ATPase subunit delta
MAEIATLARPYAEAAFRLARERQALPAWSEALGRLAQIAVDPQAASLIGNPNVPVAKVDELFRAAAGKDAEPTSELGNFVRLLTDNGRLTCLPEIAGQFAAMKQAEEGVKEGVVHSAFPLDEAQLAGLRQLLEQRFGRLQLSVNVDPALIGGVKVVIGDQVLDASVSGKLSAMRAALNS